VARGGPHQRTDSPEGRKFPRSRGYGKPKRALFWPTKST
jgi:hypothetical protein